MIKTLSMGRGWDQYIGFLFFSLDQKKTIKVYCLPKVWRQKTIRTQAIEHRLFIYIYIYKSCKSIFRIIKKFFWLAFWRKCWSNSQIYMLIGNVCGLTYIQQIILVLQIPLLQYYIKIFKVAVINYYFI